jgi:MIP family channel proteins
MNIWLAEFIGTFALVFVGISALVAGAEGLAVALAFGLTVSVMIAAVGGLSLAHFNPAVTVGFFVLGRINFLQLLLYWSAECLGAIAAIFLLEFFYGPEPLVAVNYGTTQLAADMSPLIGVGIEAVLTFFLFFVIATCVMQQQPQAGLYIGFTVTLCALAGGTLTGASMNPARSFAPALAANIWACHWVYWLGPVFGAVVAALAAQYLWQSRSDAP